MYFVRTILGILIGVSVAVGPTAGGVPVYASSTEMTMANETDMPCCPSPDDSKGIACAFKLAALFPAADDVAQIADWLPFPLADGTLQGHIIPPIHPPPI